MHTLNSTMSRASDLTTVKVKDIDFTNGIIRIGSTKTDVAKIGLLLDYNNGELANMLKDLTKDMKPDDFVFKSSTGLPVATDDINRYIQDLARTTKGVDVANFGLLDVKDGLDWGDDYKTAISKTFRKHGSSLLALAEGDFMKFNVNMVDYSKNALGHLNENMQQWYSRIAGRIKMEQYRGSKNVILTQPHPRSKALIDQHILQAVKVSRSLQWLSNNNRFSGLLREEAKFGETPTTKKKKRNLVASYDVVGNVLAESVDEESALMSKNMGAALIEMGLPKDKKDFIKEMGFYLMLQDQMDPNMLAMILKALQGEKLSRQQKGWIKNNLKPMVDGIVNYDPVKSKELNPDNPINSDEDPWALKEEKMIRVLKTLKDPVVIPETRQKSYKVSPGRRYKKGKTNFQGMEKLIGDIESQESFKTSRYSWSDGWQGYNARSSQDKKNIVLEKIGDGKQAWNYMLNNGTMRSAKQLEEFWGKNPDFYSYSFGGKKYRPTRKEQVKGDYVVFLVDEAGVNSSMLQSELNMKLAEDSEKEMLAEYNRINKVEPISYEKDPLFKRVAKILKPNIDYEDKPAVKGHPNEPPPKMVKGWHPDYGKRYKYDKLDPVSAVAMRNAPTGNPEIDANVEKAARKPKI